MTTKTKHNLGVIGICAFVLATIVTVVLVVSPRNVTSGAPGETSTAAVPLAGLELPLTHLEGQWSADENGTKFIATVVGNDIKIEMNSDDGVSALYWHGTFQTAESPGNTIVSTKTENHDEIVISQSTTKNFTVGSDWIKFKFSAMGFSKDVELRR